MRKPNRERCRLRRGLDETVGIDEPGAGDAEACEVEREAFRDGGPVRLGILTTCGSVTVGMIRYRLSGVRT